MPSTFPTLFQSRMLFDASHSTLLFVPLVLFVFSVLLVPSYSSSHKIHHVYQRQLSVTTRFTVKAVTITDTVTISPQSEILSRSSSTSSLSASFRPSLPSSFDLFTSSSSSLFSVRSSSSSSHHRKSTSLTSQTLFVTPKMTTSFLPAPSSVSTASTTVSVSASDNKVISTSPVNTSPASSNQDVPLPSFSTASAGAAGSGFWRNKGAVGGTFAAVGLVVLGISAIFLITCLKKRRNRKPEEELSSGSLDKKDLYDWPAQAGVSGLSRQPMDLDPFAAVVQIRGSSMPFMTASTSSGYGRANLEDNQTSSDEYTSSNLGRINYPYSVTYPDFCASLNPAKPASSSRSPASVSSRRTGLPDVPPTSEPALPVSPMSIASLFTIPSPCLDAEQVSRRGHRQDSGASFYAGQIHSHYYTENAESPSSARSSSRAF